MDVKECIEKGLLKETKKDIEKTHRSIEVARNKLNKAMKLQESEFYEEAVVNAYSSMFHAGRALLFKDGMKEKSHYGLYIYIREKYKNKLEPRFINELDSLRLERHEILYSLDTIKIEKQACKDVISVAKDFVSAIEKIIK